MIRAIREVHPNSRTILIYQPFRKMNLESYPKDENHKWSDVLQIPETVPGTVVIPGKVVVPDIDNIVWCYDARHVCIPFTRVAQLVEDGK